LTGFLIHPEKDIFSCSSSFIGDTLPNWDFKKRCQRTYYSSAYSFSTKILYFSIFSGFFPPRSEEIVNVLNKISGYKWPLCRYNKLMLRMLFRGRL
jgi:hypothetical protein